MTLLRLAVLGVLALLIAPVSTFAAQQKPILGYVDESKLVTLRGNVRPEVTAANDRGPVEDSTSFHDLQLVLHRNPDAEADAELYFQQLSDPSSPNYHKWLTNTQIGEMFGPAKQDIDTVKLWLETQGFKVKSVSPDRTVVEFSGDAKLVRNAFHTSIHKLRVNGEEHFANVSDPQIPADLTPVVTGIASLTDFMPYKMSRSRVKTSMKQAARNGVPSSGSGAVAYLGAADLAKIYNFTPLLTTGITGKGQTIAVIEDTNLYSANDWTTFRQNLGLSIYTFGTLTQLNPTGTNSCGNPGTNGDDGEAAIDVEWATAAAPDAAIINAACSDTTQFGGFLALANLLQGSTVPSVVSISYGESESELGAGENAYIANLYFSAALQGVSLFVSSGDEGAASSDANKSSCHPRNQREWLYLHSLQRLRRWHRLRPHLSQRHVHVLQLHQRHEFHHRPLLRSGDSLERLLRQPTRLQLSRHLRQRLVHATHSLPIRQLPYYRLRQRRPQRLCVGCACACRSRQRNLRRLFEALLAVRPRQSQRRRS